MPENNLTCQLWFHDIFSSIQVLADFTSFSVSGDCLDFTFKTLSNCYRHNYDLSISRFYKKVFVTSRIFFKQLAAFLYHFDIIFVSGDSMHFTFEKKFASRSMIYQFYDFFSSNFCSVSFSRLKYTSHSKTCQIGAGTSMIRQFHDFFG